MSEYDAKCKNSLPIIFDDRMPVTNLLPKVVNRVNGNTEDLKNLYGETESLAEDVEGKVNAPSAAGTAGQVLTSDGEGGTVWAAVGSGEIVVDPTLTVSGAAADAKVTGDEITHVKQDNNNRINFERVQYIDITKVETGKYYGHNSISINTNSPDVCILTYLIPIIKDVTYTYNNVYAYFSNIKYEDGTITTLSNDSNNFNGTFTASKSGQLYVTLKYNSTTGVVPKDAGFYNGETVPYEKPTGIYDSRYDGERIEYMDVFDYASPVEYINIDSEKITYGKYYNHESISRVNGTAAVLDYRIRIIDGVKYTYTDLYAYFCTVVYDDGTIEALSNVTSPSEQSGDFTPSKDGYLYVTLPYDRSGQLLPTSSFRASGSFPYAIEHGLAVLQDSAMHQLVNTASATIGKYYNHGSTSISSTSSAAILDPIRVIGGKTYYFQDLYAYFSGIKYDGSNTVVPLANTTESKLSGSFTAESDGYAYITLSVANGVINGEPKLYLNYIPPEDAEITIKPTTPDIIQTLLDNKGKNIHFDAGSYDIIQMYTTHFGDDYFDTYTGYSSGGDNLGAGLPVFRGTKMTFSSGAVFTAIYTGSNTNVRANFAAFWLQSGVTIDGLRLTVDNIRNCIHDDFDNVYSGTTVIKNCVLKGNVNIIAGGLAINDVVIIENCVLENTTATVYDFSYHNNGVANAQSLLVIKDNYLAHGVSIRYYGQSTLQTDVLISNNSMANDVEKRAENASALIDNITIRKWNNEIRS